MDTNIDNHSTTTTHGRNKGSEMEPGTFVWLHSSRLAMEAVYEYIQINMMLGFCTQIIYLNTNFIRGDLDNYSNEFISLGIEVTPSYSLRRLLNDVV